MRSRDEAETDLLAFVSSHPGTVTTTAAKACAMAPQVARALLQHAERDGEVIGHRPRAGGATRWRVPDGSGGADDLLTAVRITRNLINTATSGPALAQLARTLCRQVGVLDGHLLLGGALPSAWSGIPATDDVPVAGGVL